MVARSAGAGAGVGISPASVLPGRSQTSGGNPVHSWVTVYGAVTASLVPALGGIAAKAALVGVVFSKQGREMMGAVNNFSKVAKSGGDMNAAFSQLVPATKQFGATAAEGVSRYFRWMGAITKSVAVIQVAVFALTLGLQVYSWWQRRVQERQEKMLAGVKSYYDAIRESSGAHRSMSTLTADINKLSDGYREATAEAKRLSEPQKVRQTIDIQRQASGNDDRSIEEYATRALMVEGAIRDSKEEVQVSAAGLRIC